MVSAGSDSVTAVTLAAVSHFASFDCCSAVGLLGHPAVLDCPEHLGLVRAGCFASSITVGYSSWGLERRSGSVLSSDFCFCYLKCLPALAPKSFHVLRCHLHPCKAYSSA